MASPHDVKKWVVSQTIPELDTRGTAVLSHVLANFSERYAPSLTKYASVCAAEFGVWSGSSITRIAHCVPSNYQVFGFDSFEGLPEKWREGYDAGTFDTGGSLPPVPDNVTLIKGWFDQTLPQFCKTHGNCKVGLLHVDCDIYSSTKTVLEELTKADMLVDGTVVVFDELFNYAGYEDHEAKALYEWTLDNPSWSLEWIGKLEPVVVDPPKHHDVCIDQPAAVVLRRKTP